MTTAVTAPSRIPLLEREQVTSQVAALYDTLETRGVVPNMFKALSNHPELVLGVAALLKHLMAEGALPGWYKELIATRVASLNHCEYCISAHRYLALQRGASPEQVAAYDDFENGPFTEKEKAGCRYAGLCTPPVTSKTLHSLNFRRTSTPRRSWNSPPSPRPSSSSLVSIRRCAFR